MLAIDKLAVLIARLEAESATVKSVRLIAPPAASVIAKSEVSIELRATEWATARSEPLTARPVIGSVIDSSAPSIGRRQIVLVIGNLAPLIARHEIWDVQRSPGWPLPVALPLVHVSTATCRVNWLSAAVRFSRTARAALIGDRAQDRFENRDEMVDSRREQLQNRMDNRPETIEDRQQYRDDMREDRQNYRDGAREDWQRVG